MSGATALGHTMPGNRFARFRFLDGQGRWVPMAHTPKDLVAWAAELAPDVFQRTFSMFPAFQLDRPIPDGFTVGSFLDALANAAKAYHTPRIDLNPNVLTDDQALDLGRRLLDFSLTPKLRFLSLDNYPNREKAAGPGATQALLQGFLDQGWEGIELLVCGTDRRGVFLPTPPTFGLAANLVFDIPSPGAAVAGQLGAWDTNTTCRDLLRRSNPGAKLLMNIDFPWQIDFFKQLGADGMARLLAKVAEEQSVQGFSFIWPVLQLNPPPNDQQGQWDATSLSLSDGRTLYAVMRDLMREHNAKA